MIRPIGAADTNQTSNEALWSLIQKERAKQIQITITTTMIPMLKKEKKWPRYWQASRWSSSWIEEAFEALTQVRIERRQDRKDGKAEVALARTCRRIEEMPIEEV